MLVSSLSGMLHSARIDLSCEHVSAVWYRLGGFAFVHCIRHAFMTVWFRAGNRLDWRLETVAAVGLNLHPRRHDRTTA
jgi:hypothetical protein